MLRRVFIASLLLLFLAHAASAAEPDRHLRLLFLGDQGHHLPARRFQQLAPAMAKRGISLEYTEDLKSLNPETLGNYDGLVVYANIDAIEPAAAKALLSFVSAGKGFIPLHCASYCFRNNDEVVALIGAQFQRHGTGVFRVQPTTEGEQHPVLRGYGGFESWDETYVHTRHNEKNRTVLEYRIEGEEREPWTWVRTHGKGRVFYTAWGHDERTFGNPGFQNLVERGIRWACGDDPEKVPSFADRPAMTPLRKDVKPFEFVEARIPFYPPSKTWGVLAEPISKMQKPLPAEESIKHFVTPVGFHVELFATDPEIGKPLAMNWDERGRLWLCETVDYPNELQAPGRGRDRIRICEDSNGDGRADKFTVFAEHLSIPTTLAFYRGGAIVQDGPRTIYLKDTNGDDRADIRETLVTGWELGDTHGGVSNFQYGHDNWFWAMQGYNNSTPSFDNQKAQSFRMGFFRFRLSASDPPHVTDVEFIRSTNNNTWGLGFSEEGIVFGSTANGNPSEYMPIANRYYESVRGWSPQVLSGIAENDRFEPITDNVRQVDHHGGFTAAAGHALYTARAWPKEYWNRTAFVTEPTGHLVATFVITPDGSGFRSKNSWNMLASDDEWAAPIMAEVGPDGQLWVIDWYNIIVQHNPTPAGYKTGKGNAYEIELRDKIHGRIYRVVRDGAAQVASKSLQDAPPEELVAALQSDNLLWRRQAQRLLVERGKLDVLSLLVALVQDHKVDEIGINPGAIHALWTLQGLGAIDAAHGVALRAALAALQHPSAGVRRTSLQVIPRDESALKALLESGVLQDPEPQVRLSALLALAEMPPSAHVAKELVAILARSQTLDRWLTDAVTAAAAQHDHLFLEELAGVKSIPPERLEVGAIVAEHFARGNPAKTIPGVLRALAQCEPAIQEVVLVGLARGWPKDKPVTLDEPAETALIQLIKEAAPAARTHAVTLGLRLGSKQLESQIEEISGGLIETASHADTPDADRVLAARQLIEFRRNDAEVVGKILSLLTPRMNPDLVRGFLDAISKSESPDAGTAVLQSFGSLTPATRPAAIRMLVGRSDWSKSLLEAIEAGAIPLNDLSLDQKQALSAHPDRAIAKRAKDLLTKGGGLPNPDRQKVVDELMPLTRRIGDVGLGKEVFKKQCSKCHIHSGEGNKVGPDLTGMAVHPKHELLIHIIDPSRSVEGNFRVYTVLLEDGRVLNGLLAGETKTAVEIIDAEAKRHAVQREEIDELILSTKSLMPEGFEKQITPEELTNLLEFLTARGKYLPIPLDKAATIVSTKGMFNSEEADVERLIFDDWKPKVFEGVPFVLVDPQGDRIANAVMLYGTNGNIPPRMPKQVILPCNSSAKTIHMLTGVGGWSWPASVKGTVSLIVRLNYADGQSESHPLVNGVHFADYIRRVDVPGSKFAYPLRGQQIRYLSIQPKRTEKIESIELVKGDDVTSPVVMAVTVEGP